jgi:hypothetical protein
MIGRIMSILLGIGCLVAHEAFSAERTLIASSGTSRIQLLELYSSESCSSCPPADAWVSGLKEKSDLWKGVVPVVFHVDYWNQLGWKDGYSSDAMTKRQVDVSRQWPNPSVYTPALVLDGKEWRAWRESVNHALPSATKASGINLSLLREADGSFTVKVEGQRPTGRFVVRVAQLGMDLSTNVTGGENSGRLLKHNFVVLSWDSKVIEGKKSEEHFRFPAQKSPRLALAAWIEDEGNPTPLQSVGGYL